jgi:hypothetical protein
MNGGRPVLNPGGAGERPLWGAMRYDWLWPGPADLLATSFGRHRPKLAVGDFLSDWPQYFVSRRSLNSSRRTEFGASGHCRISTGDVSKIAADRLLSKMRQCANDPHPPLAIFWPSDRCTL